MTKQMKGPPFNPLALAKETQVAVELLLLEDQTKSQAQTSEPAAEIEATRQYSRLQSCYLSNRVRELYGPLEAYKLAVKEWALFSADRKHEHCQTLLAAVANPMMLNISLEKLMPKLIRRDADLELFLHDSSAKWNWLRGLQRDLLENSFRRGKYEKYKIAKPGNSGFRTIEVPNSEARIVARTLVSVLEPLVDPLFYPLSVGFRPGRSVLHGIAAAEQLLQRGLTHWVTCDIRDAFGQVPKQPLMDVLASRLHGSSVMRLVREILDVHRKRGIPQGIAISPLAMNVYLDHFLDRWWTERFPHTCLVRYADDIMIACPSRQLAIAAFEALEIRGTAIGMPVKEKQTDAVLDLTKGDVVDWLGFRIRLCGDDMKVTLGTKSRERLEFKLKEVQTRKCGGETYSREDIASIGFGRMLEKAIAFGEQQVPAAAVKIRDLANEVNLDMSGFTNERAQLAWSLGQQKWQEAREKVTDWLPLN